MQILKARNFQLEKNLEALGSLQQEVSTLQSKLESAESDRAWQQKCMINQNIEDKEILMGLEYQLENKVPETLSLLEAEITSKIKRVEKKIETISMISEKNTASFQTGLQQNKLKLDAVEQQLKMRNVTSLVSQKMKKLSMLSKNW